MLSLLGKTWQAQGDFDHRKSLFENFATLRGLSSEDLTEPHLESLADPYEFKEMKKIVDRIFAAIHEKERILLFGDYDLDGMSSVAMLLKTLRSLGAQISFRLPSRSDGYGLSEKFVREAVEHNVKLLITTDCGISNQSEILFAKNHGITTIVTDHHSVPETLPPAYAILHPLVPDEIFPAKNLTGAGVAFFLCFALLQAHYKNENFQEFLMHLLELAMFGTVADCGELRGQNRFITVLGLRELRHTSNPGLQKLLEVSQSNSENLSAETVGFYLAPRLNAAGRLAHPRIALEVLLGNVEQAHELEFFNRERQNMVDVFVSEAEEMLGKNANMLPAFVLKNAHWPPGVIGLIAGKLAEKYDRPTVILSETEEKLTASCRGPEDFHFAQALREIEDTSSGFFLNYGGHAVAAGFSLFPGKFGEFTEYFSNIVKRERGETPPTPKMRFDFSLEGSVSIDEVEELRKCEPFGAGNSAPQFCFPSLQLKDMRQVGNGGKHLSLKLQNDSGQVFSGIFFGQGNLFERLSEVSSVDVLATPEVRTWQGVKEVQLKVQDIRKETSKI